jgi:hypothetical protein
MSWVFHESDPMGGAAGEAYANTLKSPGMPQEHVLAREAIQNSVDAGVGAPKVTVRFRQRTLKGKPKAEFITAAGLSAQASRAEALELAKPNCLHNLETANRPLDLLYVEDYDAEGLSGDPHDKGSNFYRLLLSLGDRSKARTDRGTGGSYGFGKSVYSSSSAIQTIFAYTRFANADGTEMTRLFGCGYYKSHEYRGKSYSGRAWLGTGGRHDELGRMVVDPFEGRKADNLAAKLGFQLRGEGELGTTILIVDAAINLAEIVTGVEDWWWPRLIEHKLDVEVIDATDQVFVPRPRRNEQLRPFIESFEIARGLSAPKSGTQKYSPLSRLGDTNLGVCGFTVVPLNDQGLPIVRSDRCNTVALIRAPLMVVAYKSFSETSPVVVGAFMAAEDVDTALKKSEPPAHDRWDPDSVNLRDADGTWKEDVKAVLSRVKAGLKRFQGEAAPPAPAKQKRLSLLERALGSYFRPTGLGAGGAPEPTSSFIHLEFSKQPHAVATGDGQLKLLGSFNITLDGKAEDDAVDLTLRIGCPVLEDEGQEGDDLGITVKCSGVDVRVNPEDKRVYHFTLTKGSKAHFVIESDPYDPAWTVRLRPEIDEEVMS